MSQQKQAPLPRQEFQEWLENAAVPVLVLQKGKHLGSVVKVPATPEIDYLFGCETFYGERISWSDRLEFCGLYDRQHQALHLLDDPLPNFVSGLTEEECQDSTAFGKRIAQEVDRYVEAAISNERSRLSVRELTSERNINSYRYYKGTEAGREAASLVFSGEKPDVQFHSEYYTSLTEDTLLSYLKSPEDYIKTTAEQYMRDNQEEFLAQFLKKDALLAEYQMLSQDSDAPVYRMRAITDALQKSGAKTVNVTVQKNGVELTFKTSAESLKGLKSQYSTWYIAPSDRLQFRHLFGAGSDYSAEDIIRIAYGRSTLYEAPSAPAEDIEMQGMGFDLAHRYEPDCDDAYQDIVDYIRFEQETSKMWPWLISGDEMLAQETTLREIAGRLTAAGEWDTESIYESLTEAFGNNLSLDKQSKDDTKEEERNINIKQDQLDLLWQLEEFRKKHEHQAEPSDWAIRMCEAFVARSMGFTDRVQWTELLRQKGETLFTFDWKSGSVSDHVVQWCKENNRNWRYSHLGELQVAHGGEWRKVDYFCRDGSETRVYFPPKPVQEHQLQALAEDPAIHLRDLLMLGLPDHDVYLVHAAEDVGWVPAADLPRLTAQGKEEFSALLDAKIAAIRPGPYGVELVLDGVNSQLLAQYDETLANSSRAEHAMELFL